MRLLCAHTHTQSKCPKRPKQCLCFCEQHCLQLPGIWCVCLYEKCGTKHGRKNVIVPVPKKKRKGTCEVDDFRGIALGSVVYKVMCSIVQQRMSQMVEEKQLLAEEQGRFRKGRGTKYWLWCSWGRLRPCPREVWLRPSLILEKHMIELIGLKCGNVWKGREWWSEGGRSA